MPQWVYILQSESSARYYCGQTSDVERRIRQHNDPEYTFSKTTKRFAGPWRLVKSIPCDDRSQATRLERSIKKQGVARYLARALSAESRLRRD